MTEVHAVRPWDSFLAERDTDKRRQRKERPESQEEIDLCLECPLSDCIDCYRYRTFRFSYRKKEGSRC